MKAGKDASDSAARCRLDDRSGVAYQEYRCVYGEDVEAALRFLFNAMARKQIDGFPFQGIPQMIYLDSGPVAKSHVFQQVMGYLDIDVRAKSKRSALLAASNRSLRLPQAITKKSSIS
jgi:hypothetical protein